MAEFDDVHEEWEKAKANYDKAECALAMARARLTDAARAKRVVWNKLVERATERAVPNGERREGG
jgi:outer membrane protein TolC